MLFPGISQIQSALLGVAFGVIVGGASLGVLVHKLDNAKYDRYVAAQATAHSAALVHEAKAAADFGKKIDAANAKASDLMSQLATERAKKQTVLVQTLHDEGKKDATLAHCLGYKLPSSVMRQLAH